MNQGRTIFAQLMEFIPHKEFARCVEKYDGERYVKSFTCMDQYLCMAIAQLAYRESLRDIECCLRAHQSKLWHMGMRSLAARNTRYRRLYSRPVEKGAGLRCDQTVVLANYYAHRDYPDKLRLIKYLDPETAKRLSFLTNNIQLPALLVAQLYPCCWQVELFFRWIKQHLRIKAFFGTSENAVITQIWIAVSVYVLVAILKKRLHLDDLSLYTILQILSVSLFEKKPILSALTPPSCTKLLSASCNRL